MPPDATIERHRIPTNGVMRLPSGARLLCVEEEFGAFYVWALWFTANPIAERRLSIVRPYGEARGVAAAYYVGMLRAPGRVLHVFDLGEKDISEAQP